MLHQFLISRKGKKRVVKQVASATFSIFVRLLSQYIRVTKVVADHGSEFSG